MILFSQIYLLYINVLREVVHKVNFYFTQTQAKILFNSDRISWSNILPCAIIILFGFRDLILSIDLFNS
jgi:hypothetical protein